MIQLGITKHLRFNYTTQIPRAWKCPPENRFRALFTSQPNTYYSLPHKFAATLNLTLSGCLWALFGKAFACSPRKLSKKNFEARFWNRGESAVVSRVRYVISSFLKMLSMPAQQYPTWWFHLEPLVLDLWYRLMRYFDWHCWRVLELYNHLTRHGLWL